MFENNVDGLAELRNIKKTAAQLQVTNSTIISYDGYVSRIHSAVKMYDTQFTTRINSKGQKCTVYQYETNSYEKNEEYEHHIDTNIEDLIINVTNLNVLKQTQKRTRLTPSQYYELLSESQQTWDQLDDNSK